MKTSVIVAFALTAAALGASSSLAADGPLKSGLQPGEHLTTVFEPLNINGPDAGDLHCLVCENGLSPVAMIMARELDEPLVKLIAKLDAATVENAKRQMGSFAVFIADDAALEDRLKKTAEKQALKKLVLSISDPPGPDGYKLVPEAAVTVMLYNQHEIRANHAFRKGELNDAAIEKILADLPKLLRDK